MTNPSYLSTRAAELRNANSTTIDAVIVSDAPAAVSISEINQFHRRATAAADVVRKASEEACHYALLAGTRLEQLRDATPHGEWEPLFKGKNLTSNPAHISECDGFDFSESTARRYMEAAKRIRAEQSMSGIAQKKLIAIAAQPELDDTARVFLDKLTSGRTLRQLYLDLEIITAPAPKAKPETGGSESPSAPKSEKQRRLEDAREAFFLWRERFDKLVTGGSLDNLDRPGLLEMKEFIAEARDRVNARLK